MIQRMSIGTPPLGGAQRTHRGQARGNLALVVADAARIELAVAHRGLEWLRVPQLERVGGLDVVVVVQQQCKVAASPLLTINRWWRAFDVELLRAKAGVVQR